MKAAIFMGKEDVQVLNVRKPTIRIDEVLIRVAYFGICGSDISAYMNSRVNNSKYNIKG